VLDKMDFQFDKNFLMGSTQSFILFQPQGPQDANKHMRNFMQRKRNRTHVKL